MLKRLILTAACAAALAGPVLAQPAAPKALAADEAADRNFEPHRIAGNLYYVGTHSLAVFFIDTPDGAILINGVYPASVPLVLDNIRKLGFEPRRVKLILQSHAHPDHVSGNALLKAATGAKVLVMDDDVDVVRSGGRTDFQYSTIQLYPPGPVDKVLRDGDHVRLGGMDLTAVKTPGHTKGCTTWTFDVAETARTYKVVIACSLNFNPGFKLVDNAAWPGIAGGFAHSYKVAKGLAPDIWLAAHGFIYGLDAKFAKLKPGGDNPFVDPAGYRTMVETNQRNFLAEFTKQMGQFPAPQ